MAQPGDQRAAVAGVFDRASASFDAVGVEFFGPVGRALVAAAALRPGDRVLDVGCGRGAALFPAARMVGRNGRVLGIDIAPGMVAATAAEAAEHGLEQVSVEVRDAMSPGLGPDTFDAVLGGLVLFFLPDPAAALAAWAASLRPGGRLALTTFGPSDTGWEEVERVAVEHTGTAGATRPAASGRGPFSTAGGLGELVTSAGFSDVRSDDRVQEVHFRDGEHWWQWQWSTGAREAWERVPGERAPQARAAAISAAERAGGSGSGGLTWRPMIRYTTAIKA